MKQDTSKSSEGKCRSGSYKGFKNIEDMKSSHMTQISSLIHILLEIPEFRKLLEDKDLVNL